MAERHQQEIQFRFEGSAFIEEGIYVHAVAQSFFAMQNIFDTTYLTLSGKKRLSARTRHNFILVAKEIRQGSLEGHIEIFVAALPFVEQLGGPKVIWEMTKATFDFLRTIFALICEPKDFKGISVKTGDNSTVIVHNEKIVASYPFPVKDMASEALGAYRELVPLFRTGDVARIQIGENLEQPAIDVTPDIADKFGRRRFRADESVELTVEIIRFDKKRGSGRLMVLPGQKIPAGEYPFSITKQLKQSEVIESMLHNKVSIICREEVALDPLPRIVRIQVESIAWKPKA